MKRFLRCAILAPVMAAALIGTALAASDQTSTKSDPATTKPGHAVINFANLPHRIDSWQGDGTKGIYLKVGIKKWYYASFMAPCVDLPFQNAIGIVTDGMGQVDRFSSIVVGGPGGPQRCWFKTVDEVKGPPSKAKPKSE
jgi:hypothetical protein